MCDVNLAIKEKTREKAILFKLVFYGEHSHNFLLVTPPRLERGTIP